MAGDFVKKSGLRDKASKNSALASKIEQFRRDQEPSQEAHDENPYLKLLKVSKKEKQQAKTNSFNERLASKVTFNLSGGVSKSALRRRKRKEKEQLKPKMDDLLSSLPEATVNIVDSSVAKKKAFVKGVSVKPSNLPNPQKHSGHTKLLEVENQRFSQVLQDKQFQQSPFAALRQAISQSKQ
ncbi:hypothetical protein METBIDRAFT_76774 [Metschnikowia bicuspidata var. bicuspidata NRRL YB-4993]|uniref:Ribosome biogenesis protein SLX9 n=1 Tax=Metschnikowia bicuspidata var. bicuspidata NRRL YB-4993 TaxID=869754 RepID=A0A1A0HJ12_9ASCO|nr:hypothetical protein METBIDRAFT_76774 [Metschnikowia bicuspidata var. bicuspidata NRRL YB-4993]OBA23828.1 hypothetical protein METBIDRAFT_76774 [Metschnikowia bicuspidata var. bicuspidata NRRL YB-4993]